jgi:hypothetical protein
MIVFLPLLVLGFAYGCNRETGYKPFHTLYNFFTQFNIGTVIEALRNWNYGGATVYLAIVLQIAAYTFALPGEQVEGERLRDGTRLKYKVNGKTQISLKGTMTHYFLKP